MYRPDWWKPKGGPLVTDGRLAHLYLGALVPCACGLFGYSALGWGSACAFAFFVGWELLFPVLALIKPSWGGHHPFGDVSDLLAYAVGWCLGAATVLIARS
jgi:hypothetical protein